MKFLGFWGYQQVPEGFVVNDQDGETVCVVNSETVARAIAALPELLVTSEALFHACELEQAQPIEFARYRLGQALDRADGTGDFYKAS